MSYVQNSLQSDEQIVCETKVHWFVFLPTVILALFLAVGFFYFKSAFGGDDGMDTVLTYEGYLFVFCVLLAFLSALFTYMGTECALTNKRVILKTGILSRNALELRLSKCDSLRVDQGIFGRIFGYGTIVAMTGGAANHFKFIADPIGFRNAINQEASKAGY